MTNVKQQSAPLAALTERIEQQLGVGTAERVQHAYDYALQLYGTQRTLVNLTKLEHGLRSAESVFALGQTVDAVIAALLNHADADQDDGVEQDIVQIEAEFGRTVAQLLRGLRKLDIYTKGGRQKSKRTLEAIRRASFSIIDGDVRVVIIRLAMAVHTLRAAWQADYNTRLLIAHDALHIYAPLANRLGIWTVKWELEDLAFRCLEPIQYKKIAKALDERREDRDQRIESAKAKLRTAMEAQRISAEVTGRPKHIYSIFRKMERKGVGFDGIFDAHALRIIIDRDDPELDGLDEQARKHVTYAQCYRALGIVHSLWDPIPSEFDDYIQHPKPNGYRSLHTAVYDGDGKILEVQIRTRRMHDEAEQGFAAHWAYKEGGRPNANLMRQIDALRRVLNDMGDSDEKTSLLDPFNQFDRLTQDIPDKSKDRIYVFTPGGDLIDLPYGATPLDFAYAIHTMVGHRTRGAMVNDKMVPLTHKLQSGDRVQIQTFGKKDDEYSIGKPRRDWMSPSSGYAVSSKTHNRVRSWFRKHEREQNVEYGRSYIDRELKRLSVGDGVTIDELADKFGESVDDLLAKVGFGDVTLSQIEGAVALVLRDRRALGESVGRDSAETDTQDPEADEDIESIEIPLRAGQSRASKGLTIMGVTGLHARMAQCCNPIPPEPIVGYVTRGRGVTVHHQNCAQVASRREHEPERLVEADWGNAVNNSDFYQVPFRIKAYRTPGLLEKIASVLGGQNIHLVKTKSTPMRDKQRVNIFILTEVKDLEQASWIAQKLEGLQSVYEVAR